MVGLGSVSVRLVWVGVERRVRLVGGLSVVVREMVCLRDDVLISNSMGLDVMGFKVIPVKMLSLRCLMA